MPTFEYVCQTFQQKKDGQSLLILSAPAGEIRSWAGVPRKHFDYEHGFQRTLHPRRVEDLAQFYAESDLNISPTSVVIALKPEQHELESIQCEGLESDNLCRLRLDIPDFDTVSTPDLISAVVDNLTVRLGTDAISTVEENVEAAVANLADLEEEFGDDADNGDWTSAGISDELEEPGRSYLIEFFAELRGFQEGLKQIDDEDKLREVLFSILKPALLVDGQHRVYGAAEANEKIELAICAIPDAGWLEQVFQFVVINQKAKPIKPAFLNAIIATSLTDDEIERLYDRLHASGIDVEKAQLMMRVNTDAESPFRSMIDFEVEGAPGFLKFPGMNKLVRDFKSTPRSFPVLVPDADQWRETDDYWLPHFYALWEGVREYFEGQDPRLWKQPSESNPNNLLKIVTLQEIQNIMLSVWADTRTFKFRDPNDTKEVARAFWDEFPPTFFTDEWRKKGLQTSVGRRLLQDAIMETRRKANRPNWGHRRLGLFQE